MIHDDEYSTKKKPINGKSSLENNQRQGQEPHSYQALEEEKEHFPEINEKVKKKKYKYEKGNKKYGLDFKMSYETKNSKIRKVIEEELTDNDRKVSNNSNCDFEVTLPDIGTFHSLEFGVVMLETSG